MNQPKISVIVPVYNAEKWLRRCVDSILAQTYTDFELLLVDDGSTDSSGAICDEYGTIDHRVRPFHKPNGGASSTRNLALDNAKGEWITFCDADDYVYPNWLDNFIKAGNLDNYDIITQGLLCSRSISGSNNSETSYSVQTCNSDILKYCEILFQANVLGYLVIKLFRKSIIDNNNIRFNEYIKLREDLVFFLEYCSHCNKEAISVSNIGYYYFVPDWSKKYTFEKESSLTYYRSAFAIVRKLGIDLQSKLRREIREGYINLLINIFKNSNTNYQKKLLPEIKDILNTDRTVCQMNRLSKFIIYYDFSNLISLCFLKLYCKIK